MTAPDSQPSPILPQKPDSDYQTHYIIRSSKLLLLRNIYFSRLVAQWLLQLQVSFSSGVQLQFVCEPEHFGVGFCCCVLAFSLGDDWQRQEDYLRRQMMTMMTMMMTMVKARWLAIHGGPLEKTDDAILSSTRDRPVMHHLSTLLHCKEIKFT